MATYFGILIVKLHVLYIFKIRVKIHTNQILFIIRSINLFFFMYNFKLQNSKLKHLIDGIAINILDFIEIL